MDADIVMPDDISRMAYHKRKMRTYDGYISYKKGKRYKKKKTME